MVYHSILQYQYGPKPARVQRGSWADFVGGFCGVYIGVLLLNGDYHIETPEAT